MIETMLLLLSLSIASVYFISMFFMLAVYLTQTIINSRYDREPINQPEKIEISVTSRPKLACLKLINPILPVIQEVPEPEEDLVVSSSEDETISNPPSPLIFKI